MLKAETDRERQITENLGLVHTCAGRFIGRGIEYEDLVQAGCIGLIKAVDRFEPVRGFSFSTYAVPLILGEMRALFRQGGPLKLGRTTRDRARAAAKCADALTAQLGRPPNTSELARALGVSTPEAAVLINATAPVASLTQNETMEDFDVPVEAPDDLLIDRIALGQALDLLAPPDRALILLRYGRGMTQTAAAARLGMTQVQVSRREKKILAQLREAISR